MVSVNVINTGLCRSESDKKVTEVEILFVPKWISNAISWEFSRAPKRILQQI